MKTRLRKLWDWFGHDQKKKKLDLPEPELNPGGGFNPDTLSPLVWAYVGDAVYELWVRMHVVSSQATKVGQLHQESVKYVRAQAQADLLGVLEDFLTAEERDIVRRGRNVRPGSIPKAASVMAYRYSTAFEAVLGYLFLSGNVERLEEILDRIEELLFIDREDC